MLEPMETRKLVNLLPSRLTSGRRILLSLPPPHLPHRQTDTHTSYGHMNLILSSQLLALSVCSLHLPTFFFFFTRFSLAFATVLFLFPVTSHLREFEVQAKPIRRGRVSVRARSDSDTSGGVRACVCSLALCECVPPLGREEAAGEGPGGGEKAWKSSAGPACLWLALRPQALWQNTSVDDNNGHCKQRGERGAVLSP